MARAASRRQIRLAPASSSGGPVFLFRPPYGGRNATIDQISLFAAGGDGRHFGAFTQFTYDGVGRAFAWDNVDLRAIAHATIAGAPLVMGLSINNSPGIEDAWNTLPAWA